MLGPEIITITKLSDIIKASDDHDDQDGDLTMMAMIMIMIATSSEVEALAPRAMDTTRTLCFT